MKDVLLSKELISEVLTYLLYPAILWFIKSIHDDVKKLTEVTIKLTAMIDMHDKIVTDHSERIKHVEKRS